MRPRFQADADFNHKVTLGLRRRDPGIDFQDARAGGVIGLPDIGVVHRLANWALSWFHTIAASRAGPDPGMRQTTKSDRLSHNR
jgi:hypothetical protein